MSYKLSIITINYNDEIGLKKTFDSVFSQDNRDFEYIVIDGASTDGSKELITENSDKINYWISEPDKGIYNAMNKGIKAASGKFLLFLNSGDVLYNNNVIEEIIPFLKSEKDIYYGNLMYNTNSINTLLATPPSKLSFSFFLDFSLPHPASFIKKSLFESNFYYNENLKIVSDWEFFIYTICKKNVSYKYIDKIISNFDDAGISSNSDNREKMLNEKKQVLEKYFPLFLDDATQLQEIIGNKFQQIKLLKSKKISWVLLKVAINFLMLFQRKIKTNFNNYYKKVN